MGSSSIRQVGDSQTVTENGVSLELTKVFTGAGERLEIYAPRIETKIYLDALAIEGLSWGDEETIRELATKVYSLDDLKESEFDSLDVEATEASDVFEISNEFGLGYASIVTDGNRKRVKFQSPKLGYTNQLSVKTVEAITAQDSSIFTSFLKTPFGPKAHHH